MKNTNFRGKKNCEFCKLEMQNFQSIALNEHEQRTFNGDKKRGVLIVQQQIFNFMRFSPQKVFSANSYQKFNFRKLPFSVKKCRPSSFRG